MFLKYKGNNSLDFFISDIRTEINLYCLTSPSLLYQVPSLFFLLRALDIAWHPMYCGSECHQEMFETRTEHCSLNVHLQDQECEHDTAHQVIQDHGSDTMLGIMPGYY